MEVCQYLPVHGAAHVATCQYLPNLSCPLTAVPHASSWMFLLAARTYLTLTPPLLAGRQVTPSFVHSNPVPYLNWMPFMTEASPSFPTLRQP